MLALKLWVCVKLPLPFVPLLVEHALKSLFIRHQEMLVSCGGAVQLVTTFSLLLDELVTVTVQTLAFCAQSSDCLPSLIVTETSALLPELGAARTGTFTVAPYNSGMLTALA